MEWGDSGAPAFLLLPVGWGAASPECASHPGERHLGDANCSQEHAVSTLDSQLVLLLSLEET